MLRGIHKQCEKGNWDEAIYDLRVDETARNAASIPGGWGEWTPLHLACKRNAPLELIEELVKAAPIAAETFDLKDRLPIHYAMETGASIEILNALVQSCPESINGVDNSGHTPLHLGFLLDSEAGKDNARSFPSVDEVELLSDEEGLVAATADEAGNLPVHLAVNNIDRCSLDVLLTLICVDTKTLDKKNKDGLTPLHLALLNCAEKPISLDIVKALIGAAEDGEVQEEENEVLKIADNNGRLPLHLACLNFEHIPLDVMQELLRIFGGAARVPMSDGSLPLDILEGLRHTVTRPQDVLDFNEKSDLIFAHHPNIDQYRNEPSRLGRISNRIKTELAANKCLGNESRMIWTWMCRLSEEEDKDKMHFITISQTLNSIRDDATKRSLASIETVTEDGSILPLNACVSDRVAILLKRCLLFADRYELLQGDVEQSDTWCKVKALDWEDSNEQRQVVIKFMTKRDEFMHEANLRAKLQGSNSPAVIPMIENFDVGRLGTNGETTGDAKYEYDISKGENPGGVDLSQYPCAMVLQECGQSFSTTRIAAASAEDILQFTTDLADTVRRLHSCGMTHGSISASSFVQIGSKGLVFESLRSASVMQELDSSPKRHTGEASSIRTAFLPPEMFVKLSDKEMKGYMGYWNTVAGDADVNILLKSEDTRKSVAERVDSFLVGLGSGFSDLWTRITSNANLWEKIRPRKVGDSYYTVRAFHRDPVSGEALSLKKLPYALQISTARQDTWTLGLLLYQIMTGETIFRTTASGDIEDDKIFASLCNWNIDGQLEQEKMSKICNPVARDLLRMLLSNPGGESNMNDICQHAFFGNNRGESMRQCLAILKHEKNVKMQREAMMEKEERLRRRTAELTFVPSDTHSKMERSTWTQWNDPEAEAVVPTTFILLPYKLQVDEMSKLHTVAANDKKKALDYGLAIANFVHYTNFSGEIAKRYGKEITKDCCSTKLWEYSELNKSTLSITENNLLAICRGILKRIENAEQVLSAIIKTVLPDIDYVSEAKKLVRDAIEGIVDVDICVDVTTKAAAVEKAVQSLFNVANDSGSQLTTTEQIVSEQLQKLTGKDTSLEEDTKKKTDVEMTLFRLVKDFSENPLAASRGLLMKKVENVLDCFSSKASAGARLYLIDDLTGSPVSSSSSSAWPLKVALSPDTLRTLLPGMYLSIKSFCTPGMSNGLSSLLGLSLKSASKNWVSNIEWRVGNLDSISTEKELSSLHAATGSRTTGSRNQQLKQLQTFLRSKDPFDNFSGLARILCPDNRVLWTLKDDYKEEESTAHSRRRTLSISKTDAQAQSGYILGVKSTPTQSKVVPTTNFSSGEASGDFSSSEGQLSVQTKNLMAPVDEKKRDTSAKIPAQIKAQKQLVDEEQQQLEEHTPDDDITVSTLNSMLSNPAAACHALPPPPPKPSHGEGKVTKVVTSQTTTPMRTAREEKMKEGRPSLHSDVTPKAATNRTLSSSVLQPMKRTPTPVRSHRMPPSESPPIRSRSRSRSRNENSRNRGNIARTSPGVGLYKKAMSKNSGGTPVGSVSLGRKAYMSSEESDDVSVISMASTATTRKNLRRFRSKSKA